MRPLFVTEQDITRWQNILDEDDSLPEIIKLSETIKEVCFAGLWLIEQVEKSSVDVDDEMIRYLQFLGGKLSYGKDPWIIHQELLRQYELGSIKIKKESSN